MSEHFEWFVHVDEATHVYHTKGVAMLAIRDFLALGKVVTASQVRVQHRRESGMDEETTTNLLNVVRQIERCRVADLASADYAETVDQSDERRRYYVGRSDGYQLAGSILRNMLRAMGVQIPEDV